MSEVIIMDDAISEMLHLIIRARPYVTDKRLRQEIETAVERYGRTYLND